MRQETRIEFLCLIFNNTEFAWHIISIILIAYGLTENKDTEF